MTRLVHDGDLLAVAIDACAAAGVEARAQHVAYCLLVLVDKPDPVRRLSDGTIGRFYDLDPDADSFRERLEWWAGKVASNVRAWGETYEAIHDEADRREIDTLRGLIRIPHHEDVVDVLADKLALVLSTGPRLEEMSLEHARDLEPVPAQYAFQTPLPRWLATAKGRERPRDVESLDERAEQQEGGDVSDDVERAAEVAADAQRAFVTRIASLSETRGLLTEAIELADLIDRGLAGRDPTTPDAAGALVRVRAELMHVADSLAREQRAVRPMLAYLLLAMRSAPKLLRVAVLSLRADTIERAVIDALTYSMHAILADELQPVPALVRKARAAAAAERGVPKARVRALEQLLGAIEARAAALEPVGRMLDELPPVVAGVAGIATAEGTVADIVTTNRHAAAAELKTVDTWWARVFRRYAMARR